MSIAGASVYLTDEVIAELVKPVGEAAAGVSAALGYRGAGKVERAA